MQQQHPVKRYFDAEPSIYQIMAKSQNTCIKAHVSFSHPCVKKS
jgi:hypothetical protein